ncbi:hypothetical protein [Kitasatospora sp. NPDC059803]|uniref:hypothetical protein n=1 Tax=Kitasatospora sp. NPDC059803 TaxID=3346953 RepID=UPI00364E81F5
MSATLPATFLAAPATDLGGFSLGAFTAGGLAAVGTAAAIFLLKKGVNPKIDRLIKWEHMAAAGFIVANLYAAAGWNALAALIHGLTGTPAAAWGSGALALIITAWIGLRTHSRWRATALGFTAAVLYNTAGGWWSVGSMLIVKAVTSVPGMGG